MTQQMSRRTVLIVGASALLGLAAPAAGQDAYPSKTIELIIPFAAGGGADIEGRLLAKEMSKILGADIVPINKPGGGGAVTYAHVKNAKPDGYTLAWNSTSILTSTNLGNVPFKQDALDHIGRVEWQPMPFAVKADAKWKTFEEFVADCKASPSTYKVANSGAGSATHVAALALMEAARCKVVHLPVGVKRRNASVLSGEADAMVAPLTGAINLARGGKLRLLAIPSAQRNPVVPDVPTAQELGFDASLDLFRGLSVPKGTPPRIKAKLAYAMTVAAKSEAFQELAGKSGFTVDPLPVGDFERLLEVEDAKVKRIMQSAGLYQSKAAN
ncbi:MAG: tripartite tricarboxylate transporter substrate binding protein [Kiloniellales bacterium]|nr:tripartite tricarboxylate transporter substrate binding protein [Kiloniellales bacterium]